MKKIFALIVSVISMTVCCAYANTTEVATAVQTEDCKQAGNVDVSIAYISGCRVRAEAKNFNTYRVTIRYKIYATNGIQNYPIDSGVLSIGPGNDSGPGRASGPIVSVPDGYSCYLEIDEPKYCS